MSKAVLSTMLRMIELEYSGREADFVEYRRLFRTLPGTAPSRSDEYIRQEFDRGVLRHQKDRSPHGQTD